METHLGCVVASARIRGAKKKRPCVGREGKCQVQGLKGERDISLVADVGHLAHTAHMNFVER